MQLARLRNAAEHPLPGENVTVRRRDLRELLLHFDRLENEARYRAEHSREAVIEGMRVDFEKPAQKLARCEEVERSELEAALARLRY